MRLRYLTLCALFLTACSGAVSETGPGSGPDTVAETALASTSPDEASQDRADETTTAADTPDNATVAWRSDLRPVTGPVLVDGVLVLYTLRDDGHLMLTGLDPDDGSQVWSKLATTSGVATARTLEPVVLDGDVVHLQPRVSNESPREGLAEVVVRRAADGSSVGTHHPGVYARFPDRCPGSDEDICTVRLGEDGLLTAPQVAGRTAAQGHQWDPAGPGAWRFVERVGPLDLARADGRAIGRLADDALLWTASLEKMVGSNASTNSGWRFVSGGDDLLVGSVGLAHEIDGSDLDLTGSAVFALDAATGERVWIDRGSDLACNSPHHAAGGPLLACHFGSGVLRWSEEGSGWFDAEIDLVRLDERTGEQLWSVPVMDGDLEAIVSTGVLDERHVVALGTVVDVETGSARELTDGDEVWYRDNTPLGLDTPSSLEDRVSGAGRWHLPRGTDLDDPATVPSWPLPPGVGVDLEDGSRVVAHSEGVGRLTAPEEAP